MADYPKFFSPDHDPLSVFLLRVRCCTFSHLQEYLRPYYRSHFPPDKRSKKQSGWNRHCNLATDYRVKLLEERGELVKHTGRHRGRVAELYPGAWLETDFANDIDLEAISTAFLQDFNDLRGEHIDRSEFFSPPEYKALIENAHSKEGRSEFVNCQLTLASFYLYLALAEEPRYRALHETWQLLPLGDRYATYLESYQGDVIARDDMGEIVICSPTIPGWWEKPSLEKELSAMTRKLTGTRCIFLAPLGFHAWKTKGPVDPTSH